MTGIYIEATGGVLVMPVGEKQTFRFGPFRLDTQCGQLRKNGVGLKLQGQPVQILEILLEKPGELVSREELRQRLWSSDTFVDFDHSLNTAIKRLRQALGDEAESPQYIETIPRRGYRFIGEVIHDGAGTQNEQAAAVGDIVDKAVPTLVDDARSASRNSSALRRWRIFAIPILSLLIVAVIGYWLFRPYPQPRIVGAHALTKGGHPKERAILTDGRYVYFHELRAGRGWVTMQVPVEGGEASEIPNAKGHIKDISPDGTQLLLMQWGQPNTLWTMTLPSGIPRLLANNISGWAVWNSGTRSVLFSSNNDTELWHVNADGTDVRLVKKVQDISFMHRSPSESRLRFAVAPRGFELAEFNSDGSNLHDLFRGHKWVVGGSWSPDEKYYFFSSWDGERQALWGARDRLHWWNRTPTTPTKLTFGPMSVTAPIVSGDGRHLFASAGQRRGELSVYDPKSGMFVPYLGGMSACFVDFSRDGQWITYVSYPEGNLWRSKLDGSERRQLTLPPLAVINPRWSPDGKFIAFADMSNGDRSQMDFTTPNRIYMISAEGGGPVLLTNGGDPTWSPDGNSIAYGTGGDGSEIRTLDLRTMRSTKVPGSDGFGSARWSPDGKYLLALGPGFPVSRLMLFDFAQNKWRTLSEGVAFAWDSWSRDSKFVYTQDGFNFGRISLSGKREQIVSVVGLPSTAYFFDQWGTVWLGSTANGWFGITPDGRPITTIDKGIAEIYAFDLEYK